VGGGRESYGVDGPIRADGRDEDPHEGRRIVVIVGERWGRGVLPGEGSELAQKGVCFDEDGALGGGPGGGVEELPANHGVGEQKGEYVDEGGGEGR
jgi:hypothetical protein